LLLNRAALSIVSALALAGIVQGTLPRSAHAATTSRILAQAETADPALSAVGILPTNAAGVVMLNTSDATWASLNQFSLFSDVVSGLGTYLSLASGIDYSKDIQPWLGDRVGFVLLPLEKPLSQDKQTKPKPKPPAGRPPVRPSSKPPVPVPAPVPSGSEPVPSDTELPASWESQAAAAQDLIDNSLVLFAAVKDAEGVKTLIESAKTSSKTSPNTQVTERQYKGITIVEMATKLPPCSELPKETAEPGTNCIPKGKPKSDRPSPMGQMQNLSDSALTLASRVTGLKPSQRQIALRLKATGAKEHTNARSAQEMAIAILPDAVVFALKPRAIERVIDTQQSGMNLSQNPQFERTMQHPQAKRALSLAYGNVAELVEYIKAAPMPPNSALPLPIPVPLPVLIPDRAELERQLKTAVDTYSTLDGLVWVQPEGIRTQGSAYYTQSRPELAGVVAPDADKILTQLPGSTYSATTSRNLNQQWQTALKPIEADPKLKDNLAEFRKYVRDTVGLDIDRDIVSWMDGEYALVLFPSKRSILGMIDPAFGLGAAFVMQTSDRTAAENAIAKLETFVVKKAKGDLTIASRTANGQPMTSWEVKDGKKAQSVLAHGWVDQNTLIITTGIGSLADLAPKPYQLLSASYTFQTATGSLPRPNDGYFYVNTGASLSFIYALVGQFLEGPYLNQFKEVAGTIRSVSATNSVTADKAQFDSLLVLAPTKSRATVSK